MENHTDIETLLTKYFEGNTAAGERTDRSLAECR